MNYPIGIAVGMSVSNQNNTDIHATLVIIGICILIVGFIFYKLIKE